MSAVPAAVAVFEGKARWLLWPMVYAHFAMAIVAGFYGSLAMPVLVADSQRVAGYSALVTAFGFAIWAWRAQAKLRTLRHVADGRASASTENVLAAILEARRLPDWLRLSTLAMWCGTVWVSAFGDGFVSEVALGSQLRLASQALTIGPLASVLVYLLAVRRARSFVAQASALLPGATVLAALQTEKKQQVRTRLVVFTAIVVVLPSVIVIDTARVQTGLVLQKVAAAARDDQAQVAAQEARDAAVRVFSLAALLGVMALGAGYLAGSSLADPMREVTEEANRIAKGDLRDVRVIPAEDEVWVVTSTFTLMQAQLGEVVGQLQRAGISIGATTEQLMATSSKYESGAADQASSLNETSATTEELAQSARQISHNAGSVSELAEKTLEAARDGQSSAKAFVSAVDRMRTDNQSIAEAVTRLQKRVQQIGRIVEFITTVADRSDLLALSAELEGTKAGDVGRGFTLVAAEMRRLAENVIESTNEIEELISEIREATQATVAATALGMEHTESGTSLAGNVSVALQQVVGLAQTTSDSVRAISLATQQQQTSTDQLAEAMADILGITQQSLAATKQVTSANHELISLSGDLKSLVEKFQVRT